MREQDLLALMARTTHLLRLLGRLEDNEELAMLKGSKVDGIPWAVTVVTDRDSSSAPDRTHPVLNLVGWSGSLGETKREMGQSLEHINRVLIAWAHETDRLGDE